MLDTEKYFSEILPGKILPKEPRASALCGGWSREF